MYSFAEYPTISSGGPVYGRKKASRDEIELFSVLSSGKRTSRSHVVGGGTGNSSQENILGDDGIRKTIDVSVMEEKEAKEKM